MMFVTDLTAFAENGFYPEVKGIYPCMCDIKFSVKIAAEQSFHVRCDECGQLGIVKTISYGHTTKDGEALLEPVFVLEGEFFGDLKFEPVDEYKLKDGV